MILVLSAHCPTGGDVLAPLQHACELKCVQRQSATASAFGTGNWWLWCPDCALSVDSQVLPSSQPSSERWIWMQGRDGPCIPDQLKGLRLGYSSLPAFSGHSWEKELVMEVRKICTDSKTLEGWVFSLYREAIDSVHSCSCARRWRWTSLPLLLSLSARNISWQTVADSYDSCLLDFPQSLQWVQSEFRCTVTTRWHTWLWMCITVSLPTETQGWVF